MEPPNIPRKRLIIDYCDEETTTPVTRRVPSRDEWISPQRSSMDIIPEKPERISSTPIAQPQDLTLTPINESSSYEHSVSTQPTSYSGQSATRLADFFSPDVLHIVLHNPTTAHQLRKFARSRLCGENLDFLEKIDQYHLSLNQVTRTLFDIHRNFISVNSESQVNLEEDVLVQINRNLKQLLSKTMPNMESIFVTAQSDIEKLIATDIYPRFVRHQMTMSATRALATNLNKYGGLGDAFVLTNPNMADNPIVYASDGFVKVTGYRRNEIIPRNCRFLQNRQTDSESVKRIKLSLDDPAECVELLLNERKDGEPFWNLLYTAPLYHPNGRLAFFLGGQINVSTTIHNTSDILRILSHNSDEDDNEPTIQPQQNQPPPPQQSTMKSYRQSFLNTLRRQRSANNTISTSTTTSTHSYGPSSDGGPGMEPSLLSTLSHLSIHNQKQAFHTAYSKYLVIDTDTMLIAFTSPTVTSLLYPIQTHGISSHSTSLTLLDRSRLIIGQEIFKFLSSHTPNGKLPGEYKARVKAALKSGGAVSLDVVLSTKLGNGGETFVTHWTPLKNEFNALGFVVVTFGWRGDGRGEIERGGTRWGGR